MAGDDIRSRADRSRGGDVERLGTARRAAGSSPATSQAASTSAGSPSRSAPRQSVAAPASASSPSPPWATSAARGAGVSPIPARAERLGEDRAHARPHRLRREGVGAAGAEHDRAAEQRVRGAHDRADVAGVADPVQVDAGRAAAPRPSAAARPRSPGSPSRASRPRRAARARPPRRPAPPAAVSSERGSRAGGEPRRQQVLALGHEQALALAVLALAQLADQLQLLVLGALDHLVSVVSVFFSCVSSPGTKKAGRETARPGKWSVGCG